MKTKASLIGFSILISILCSCNHGGYREPSESIKQLIIGKLSFEVTRWNYTGGSGAISGKHTSHLTLYLLNPDTNKEYSIFTGMSETGFFYVTGIPAGNYEIKSIRLDYKHGNNRSWITNRFKNDSRYFSIQSGVINNIGIISTTGEGGVRKEDYKITSESYGSGYNDCIMAFKTAHPDSKWLEKPTVNVTFAKKTKAE